MKKLWQNFGREDGTTLETVPEIPIPEEMLHTKNGSRWRQNTKTWMGISHDSKETSTSSIVGERSGELQLLLGVVGAPLIPIPICTEHSLDPNMKEHPIESLMAKYIVQQYVAATGGKQVLNSINSMYAIGKVVMSASEMHSEDNREGNNIKSSKMISRVVKKPQEGGDHVGGFVLWQKRPELWCVELVVSGCKISAGSDGKVAWRQTPWHHSHASRGPPRPLRRSVQGLDPRSTANLFSNAVCIEDEKTINNEACFPLKLEADPSALKNRSGTNVEIIRHTVWGYFSQRTGLLVHLEDTHLLRIKASDTDTALYWETTMSSSIGNYKLVDGVNIAHSGKTIVSLFRFGDDINSDHTHARTLMEETWTIEEVEFNIWGLSTDCFLPPGDLKKQRNINIGCRVKRRDHVPPPPPSSTNMLMGSRSRRVVKIQMQPTPDPIMEEDEEGEP
ncbi:hypothetical protein H6P81_006143 [Aristolochia fimbriata]|uniref:Uncharacterized protein n=1 Tax=Aristolochia fimbriata TaxID=158543 RepID=A0AAV7EXI4_ARIFI|nr:hypothetical protein H6P81_006143 [Aristolochia fimbriata]